MNLRLILAVFLLLVPFIVKGQEAAEDIKLYSEGKMYVGENYTTSTEPSLFIKGSAAFSNTSEDANKTQIEQIGVTKLTGDFVDMIVPKNAAGVYLPDSLFTQNSWTAAKKGVIWFAGEDALQRIYRDVDAFEVVPPKNRVSYINFPTLRVDQTISATTDLGKFGYVAVDTSSAISIKNLEIGGGAVGVDKYKGGFAVNASYMGGQPDRIKSAYALIRDINGGTPETSKGWSRVDLKLNDPSKPNTYIPNYSPGMELDPNNVNATRKYLTGFTSPFKELAADYMFFHVLFKPNFRDLTSNEGPQQNPTFKMNAGRGYFVAMDVSAFDKDIIEGNHTGVKYGNRFQGEYQFSRNLLNNYSNPVGGAKPNFSQFTAEAAEEYFNTKDVTVTLEPGLNFLGNPFMVPLDLTPLVGESKDAVDHVAIGLFTYADTYTSEFYGGGGSITFNVGDPVLVSRPYRMTDYDLRAKFWIFKNASIRYDENNGGWYYYSVSHLSGHLEGNTVGDPSATFEDNSDYMISPFGLFCVQTASDKTFKINIQRPSEKVFTDGSVVHLPKSLKSNNVVDELLITAIDLESGIDDKTCLVFRDKTMAGSEYAYIETRKNLTADFENSENFVLPEGSIYTKSVDGRPMLTNTVAKNVKQMALYVVPPTDRAKHILLKPYRMESLQSINRVWVEDKLNPDVYEELTPEGLDYIVEPSTEDPKKNLANRFVLYFNELPNDNGGKPIGENSFMVYYYGSTLTVKGVLDSDLGSKVDIYDMQGRIVASTTLNNVPVTTFTKSLAQGTYIVKIKGKRNHTSKFISLQN